SVRGIRFQYPTWVASRQEQWKRVVFSLTNQLFRATEQGMKYLGWRWGDPYRYKNAWVKTNWFILEKQSAVQK
ncbi:MAG: hypothetical protein V3U90_07145, partial [Dehalococcoidia bacterium]